MTTPEALRDAGMEAAEAAADPRLVLMVDNVIADLNASGRKWSANEARDLLPVVAGPLVGARVRAAAMRRPVEMVSVGRVKSTLLSTHSAEIRVWQGIDAVEAEVMAS
jgi:hypothetical protein